MKIQVNGKAQEMEYSLALRLLEQGLARLVPAAEKPAKKEAAKKGADA